MSEKLLRKHRLPRIRSLPRPYYALEKKKRFSIETGEEDTARLLDAILPTWDDIWAADVSQDWDNAVLKQNVTLQGLQGAGKSHTARYLVCEAKKRLEGESFHALRDADRIPDLLDNLDGDALAQCIFAEDLTSALKALSVKEQQEAAKDWFRIRHKLRDATGSQHGFILAIIALHRFHGTLPEFTTDSDVIIFKSIPGNVYDRNVVQNHIGEDGVKFLRMVQKKRKKQPQYKGYGIWYYQEQTGVWFNPKFDEVDPFEPLPEIQEEKVPAVNRAPRVLNDGEISFNPVDTIRDLDFLEDIYHMVPKVLARGDVKVKKYKPHHADAWLEHYHKGISMDNLCSVYDKNSMATFGNDYKNGGWFSIFDQELIGYAAEEALQYKYFPECIVDGGNEPGRPDLFNPDSGMMVEVKVRKRVENPKAKHFSSSEIQNIKAGKPTQIVIINYGKGRCTIRVWEALFNPTPNMNTSPYASHQAPETEIQLNEATEPVSTETRKPKKPGRTGVEQRDEEVN